MKSPILTGILLLATGTITHAQFSLLPQAGFEQSRTTLQYNSLSASGVEENLRASLKLDYRFKGGHGPFINLGTSPAPINFAFNNEGLLLNGNQPGRGNLQFRMEAGYQYTSSPIQLGKSKSASKKKAVSKYSENPAQRKTCGSSVYRSHCGAQKSSTKTAPVNKALNLRLQPSVALAYVPSDNESFEQTANGFKYNATNWKTAIAPAMGFEFGKGRQRLFTLTVFYTKPLGLNDETVTSFSGSKPYMTNFNPKASTWGMTIGLPFSFANAANRKVKTVKEEVQQQTTPYRRCTRL